MSRRLSPNNRVRRVLFPSNGHEAEHDNLDNKQREEAKREMEEKSRKWHYDFENDCPLPGEGPVKWLTVRNEKQIGIIQDYGETHNNASATLEDEYINDDGLNECDKICDDNNQVSHEISANVSEISKITENKRGETDRNKIKEEITEHTNGYNAHVNDETPTKKRIKVEYANDSFTNKSTL